MLLTLVNYKPELVARNTTATPTMKLSLVFGLVFASGLIEMAVGIYCPTSQCGACWKTGSPGVDIKFWCDVSPNDCGDTCPEGYEGIHCAKDFRCL